MFWVVLWAIILGAFMSTALLQGWIFGAIGVALCVYRLKESVDDRR